MPGLKTRPTFLSNGSALLPDRSRLRAGDEGFVDRPWSAGVRRGAGTLVDGNEHDIARRFELRLILPAGDPRLHDLDPDRQRRLRTAHPWPERPALVVAHPHRQRDVRIEADEPRVREVVGGAGLAA